MRFSATVGAETEIEVALVGQLRATVEQLTELRAWGSAGSRAFPRLLHRIGVENAEEIDGKAGEVTTEHHDLSRADSLALGGGSGLGWPCWSLARTLRVGRWSEDPRPGVSRIGSVHGGLDIRVLRHLG